MHMKLFPRLPLAAASLALALLAACAEAPPPPPPAPPPPPPPPPGISLAPSILEEASAYRGYMARAGAISPGFMDGLAIQQALKTGEAYEPRQIVRGAVAYAAVVALQDPAFVAGVRKYVGDSTQRREIAAQLIANPAYVVGIEGSDSAAGMIVHELGDDATHLFNAGRDVKQSAYDIQHQDWSKTAVPDREGRLILAKMLSTSRIKGDVADVALLQQASVGSASLNLAAGRRSPPYTPLVVRGMAVAALAALGQAGENNSSQLDSLLGDPVTGYCLDMAKLNLYQCLAVAKPHYEDIFCLGQHVMMDTGQCLMRGVGAPMPIMVATQPLTLPSATPVKIVPPKSKKAAAAPKKK